MNDIRLKLAKLPVVLRHVVLKLASLTLGRVYTSGPVTALRQSRDQRNALPTFSGRAALVAHVFYPELMGEIVACFATFPDGSGLILTCPPDRATRVAEATRSALTQFGQDDRKAHIVAVENRGRDIAPFLHLLNAGTLASYDAVLKLHTKRSPHLLDGDIRRRLLYDALAGSRHTTGAILTLFEAPITGLVGWRIAWRNSPLFWMKNRARVADLSRALHCSEPESPTFFEGTMFWLRPAALKRLADLKLEPKDFEVEAGQTDGTLHHAIERIFSNIAAADGFATRDISGSILLSSASQPSGVR